MRIMPVVSVYHGDQAYSTSVPDCENNKDRYVFRDILTFDLLRNEENLTVYLGYYAAKRFQEIAHANVILKQVQKYPDLSKRWNVNLVDDKEKVVGRLEYQIELVNEVFPTLVKAFPVVYVEAKQAKGVKIKYTNKTQRSKNYFVGTADVNIVTVLNQDLSVEAGGVGEIQMKIEDGGEVKSANCKVDVWNKERNEIEEIFLNIGGEYDYVLK